MLFKFLLIAVLSLSCYQAKDLPADIHKCKAGDVQCIANVSTEILRNSGKTGRPDLGIPPYEPFAVGNVDVLSDASEGDRPVSLQLNLKDLLIHGVSGVTVERLVGFERDPKQSKFEIYAVAPILKVIGQYKSSGRILILPVNGEGNFNLDLKNVKVNIKFKPRVLEQGGNKYINLEKVKLYLEPQSANISLERFVKNDNALGDSINQFLNENWQEFWKEIYPSINKAVLKVVKGIMSKPFEIFPYDDLYLPN